MEDLEVFGFIAMGIIVFGALRIGYVMFRSSRVESVAKRLGGRYVSGSDRLLGEVSSFALGKRGKSKRCTDCIVGQLEGVKYLLFNYSYRIFDEDSDSHTYHPQTCALLKPEGFFFPHFVLKKRSLVRNLIGDGFGGQLEIPITPEFDSRFTVTTMDPLAARDVFTTEVIDFLMNRCEMPNSVVSSDFAVESNQQDFLTYSPDRLISPASLELFLKNSIELMRHFQRSAELSDNVAFSKTPRLATGYAGS